MKKSKFIEGQLVFALKHWYIIAIYAHFDC